MLLRCEERVTSLCQTTSGERTWCEEVVGKAGCELRPGRVQSLRTKVVERVSLFRVLRVIDHAVGAALADWRVTSHSESK
jgi:hypothetical protein